MKIAGKALSALAFSGFLTGLIESTSSSSFASNSQSQNDGVAASTLTSTSTLEAVNPDEARELEDSFLKNYMTTPSSDRNFNSDILDEFERNRNLQVCNGPLIRNGDGNSPDPAGGNFEWAGSRCTMTTIDGGFHPTSKAFVATDRLDLNSGVMQYLTPESMGCLTEGVSATFRMYLKLEDANGDPFACSGSTWNTPTTCPLLSFRITKADGTSMWFNVWNEANLLLTGGWQADAYNLYIVDFDVSADMANASEIYVIIRGPAQPIKVYMSDATFELDGLPTAVPSSAPTIAVSDTPTIQASDSPSVATTPRPTHPPASIPTYTSAEADLCDMGVYNGDFESGNVDPAPWSVNHGGILSLYDNSAANQTGNLYALKCGGRESMHDGPRHPLSTACFVTDRTVEVRAKIKLWNETSDTGYDCNPLAGRNSTCPILTVETIYDTGDFHIYSPNDATFAWDVDGFNDFHAFFTITEEMTLANEAYFYFEKPPPDIAIIVDDVVVLEFQPVPVGNFDLEGDDFNYPNCNDIVVNGDAESGDTSGWTPRLGGRLTIRPEGADSTNFSFEHNGRSSFIMGPKHPLKTQCFVEGARYAFDAKIKLLDENGAPFACDKSHTWVDEKSCPILTFQVQDSNGKSWSYYGNEAPGEWNADIWNPFNTFFEITPQMANSIDSYFYIERPRAGITIIIDQVVISRDCTKLVTHGDAENGSTNGWVVKNNAGGFIAIHPEGAAGSANSYGHFSRTFNGGGAAHRIDVGCMVLGNQYEFIAYFKLIDELNGNAPFHCNKNAPWGADDFCPLFAITLVDANGQPGNARNYNNLDPSAWNATGFNRYSALFPVDEELATAQEAWILIKGPRAGIAVLMDNIEIRIYEPPEQNCDAIISNGDFEQGSMEGWHIRDSGGGALSILNQGAEGSSKSLMLVERQAIGAGIKYDLNTTCLVEGKRYNFRTFHRLFVEDTMEPFVCDRSKGYGDPLQCPLLGFDITVNGTRSVAHYGNEHPGVVEADQWNEYQTIFTVSHEMASADSAFLMFQGATPGINIAIDRVSMNVYEPPTANCQQLVVNNNAEHGVLQGWKVNGPGGISIREGGSQGSANSFVMTHRTEIRSGPRQDLPIFCLSRLDDTYTFNADMKLLDEDGNEFACDKSAMWNTALTCPLLTFELNHPDGTKRIHKGNEYGGTWMANEWNQFRSTLTVTQDIVEANSLFFYFQGPAPGVSVVFDNVSLMANQPPPEIS